MATPPARLSIVSHRRACGWTPVPPISQPDSAHRSPTVRGCSLCDGCLCRGFGLDRGSSPLAQMISAMAVLALVFLVALLVWANARRRLLNGGIPEGRIVYQDTDRRRNVERPLVSHRYGLSGKPDYLVERSNELIPVEVKSCRCPSSGPYASNAAQLTAYCVLVEDCCGLTPSHGIIQYANRTCPIRYTVKGANDCLRFSMKCAPPVTSKRFTATTPRPVGVEPAAIEPPVTRH